MLLVDAEEVLVTTWLSVLDSSDISIVYIDAHFFTPIIS